MPRQTHAALGFLVASAARAAGHVHWMMDNPAPHLLESSEDAAAPGARFAVQAQDHFDESNKNSWLQAYYVNDTFWTPGSAAPVFLCVGGEGPPIDGSAVVKSVHCNVAVEWLSEKKALMFALEHRYYGCHNMSACPVKHFNGTSALKYLSSRQAVEDVASFVRQMRKLYGLTDANKWVTFGGSYPGMLAGWSRLRHPELIHAAVASSAPVHAKLDMSEYNDALANAYTVSDNRVGGSPECRIAIREGHRQLEVMLESSEGAAAAERLLGFAKGDLSTLEQQQNLLGSGAAEFPGQENDPACGYEACNIRKICVIMLDTSHGNEAHRLAVVRQRQSAWPSKSARDLLTSGLSDVLPNFWFYQTCTEFGFYQTCLKDSNCMFVQNLDVQAMAKGCKDYGISIPDIAENIKATNRHYGGLTPFGPSEKLGSCVVWPNGEVDPWATLSVLKSPGAAQPVIWVEGASHHAWTHPSAGSDQASVVEARGKIRRQVDDFLQQDCSETKLQSQLIV